MSTTTAIAEVPNQVSYFHVTDSGVVEEAAICRRANVYIEENQVGMLRDREVRNYILNTIGPIVGIMHRRGFSFEPPIHDTPMYVLSM